jgi:hypothetical protein
MARTVDRRDSAAVPPVLSRRRALAGLAGVPVALALGACTSPAPQPEPSDTASTTGAGSPSTPPAAPPDPDAPALEATARDAMALLAAYEATIAAHPTLGAVLASYAADHDTHLDALAERVTLPTSAATTSSPTGSATAAPTSGQPGPSSTALPVPADPAAARAAIVQAEQVTGESARDAARKARNGEVARLLASIGASRAVHALLLGAPG